MPKPSRFSGEQHSDVCLIARRLRQRMNELGLSQVALAARCAGVAQDLFPGDRTPQITRERIAKILMLCKSSPGKSAARVVSQAELQILSTVLQVSIEWLVTKNGGRDLVLWNPATDPTHAEHILHLMNEHEDRAKEVLIWAEYLICSLVTPEFMHEHHEALFTEFDLLGRPDEKRRVVQVYDYVGAARRKRLQDSLKRSRRLVQLIFASDIARIASGEGEYANIRKGLRKSCLQNASKVLSDASLGIELVILRDEDATRLRAAFRDYDSIGVFGDSLVLWRHHSGRISWSEHFGHAAAYHAMLKAIEKSAGIGSTNDVLEIVEGLADSIR